MNEVVQLINNVGVPVAMLLYFVWRDAKYMSKIDSTLDVIKAFIGEKKNESNDSTGQYE